jgi:hypothetical protein
MNKALLSVICCAMLTAAAAGQGLFGPAGTSYVNPGTSGLFSADRISMRQSFTTSYLSSGKQGVFTNLYTNTIGYRVSDKLQLQLGLGYRFTPSAAGQQAGGRLGLQGNRGMFLPSFSMRYQPTEAVMFQFQYQTVDPYQMMWWGR